MHKNSAGSKRRLVSWNSRLDVRDLTWHRRMRDSNRHSPPRALATSRWPWMRSLLSCEMRLSHWLRTSPRGRPRPSPLRVGDSAAGGGNDSSADPARSKASGCFSLQRVQTRRSGRPTSRDLPPRTRRSRRSEATWSTASTSAPTAPSSKASAWWSPGIRSVQMSCSSNFVASSCCAAPAGSRRSRSHCHPAACCERSHAGLAVARVSSHAEAQDSRSSTSTTTCACT